MTKAEIVCNLKNHIINDLYRTGMSPEELDENSPLFTEDGVGLDSLDAVELVMFIEKDYGLVIENTDSIRQIFATLSTLAEYILANGSSK